MSQGDEFRISKSGAGYCVELWRNNLFYVSFADALTKEAADRARRDFNALWTKLSDPVPDSLTANNNTLFTEGSHRK